MKKLTILTFIIGFLISGISAQSLNFKDSTGTNVNGQNVTVNGTTSKAEYKLALDIENSSSSGMDVTVKRYEVSVTSGTKNFFCWSVCYAAMDAGSQPFFEDFTPVNVPGMGVNDSDFTAYHRPEGQAGVSTYRYVAYDDANPNDSSYVDITFDILVGVEENVRENFEFKIYPNPANSTVNIEYDKGYAGKRQDLVIYDLLGKEIFTRKLSPNNGKGISIPIDHIEPGVYFIGIRSDGEMIKTEKLIINR